MRFSKIKTMKRVINIYQERKFLTDLSTTGDFYCHDPMFHYSCLEDPVRDEKIAKVTAIPEGVYRLKIKRVDTPLTLVYRNKYPWFKFHIEITGVPGFKPVVYIHVGNKPGDTDGCVLLGMGKKKDWVSSSLDAFKDFYEKMYGLIENEENEVYLHIDNCF